MYKSNIRIVRAVALLWPWTAGRGCIWGLAKEAFVPGERILGKGPSKPLVEGTPMVSFRRAPRHSNTDSHALKRDTMRIQDVVSRFIGVSFSIEGFRAPSVHACWTNAYLGVTLVPATRPFLRGGLSNCLTCRYLYLGQDRAARTESRVGPMRVLRATKVGGTAQMFGTPLTTCP